MYSKVDYISVRSKGNGHIIDVTSDVKRILLESGKQNGILCVFIPGATGAVTTIEYEPGLIQDMAEVLEQLAPRHKTYHHDQTWHDGNGHSHIRASLLGPSLSVPFVDGSMTLGTWQQIVFIDMDVRARSRKLVVQIVGE